jgi:S-DNA-T family DNA segregation ATPase FtsK/SpoIIIE
LVGIEVPNATKSFVTLRSVLESKKFQSLNMPLQVALGLGVSGEVAVTSLIKMPHLLIAGATGSGKSVCLNTIIATLLFTHAPEELRLLMIDPKMVELTSYNGIPHLIAPVVTDFEQVVGALSWVTREMERRYKLFAKIGARSIDTYNQKVEDPNEQLPYLVVVIDELADLMMMAPDEVEHHICRIAQMARATGIHLVIATQRPSTDVITGLIKANFPARIAFAVSSQIDSRVILDSQGAEKLLGQGDMLFMSPDSSKLLRLQGCFIADKEIQNLVDYWKKNKVSPTHATNATEMITAAELPWTDILAENEKDDLLEQAVKIVTESGRASASFLQRRLGVGYPRASRLLDQLEGEGVIGPAEGSKGREVLWRESKDEVDYAEFEDDVLGDDEDKV